MDANWTLTLVTWLHGAAHPCLRWRPRWLLLDASAQCSEPFLSWPSWRPAAVAATNLEVLVHQAEAHQRVPVEAPPLTAVWMHPLRKRSSSNIRKLRRAVI